MINDIKKFYQQNHKKSDSQEVLDYLNRRVFETMESFFDEILKKPFRGRMLDLGCGDGSFVRYSNKNGVSALGIDISDGINFEKDKLPYEDNAFDIVFMYSVVEHISDPSNIFDEIKRVLMGGGVLIIITPNFDYTSKIFYDDPTHIKPYNPRNIAYLMKLFDFKEEFIGLWTVKKSSFVWKLPRWLQFYYGRLLPFIGTNRFVPYFLRGKSKTMLAAFSVDKKEIFNEEKEGAEKNKIGTEMYDFLKKLFPICRSITGNGVRETLKIIQEHIPIKVHEVPTGTKVFDWTVPREWNIKDAYVTDENGNKIIDFMNNNLHVVSYSVPVNKIVSLSELQEHLYSLPEQPEAIPYVTSFYEERWGFCIAHKDREKLNEGKYKVFIDSELKNGSLTYGELIISGKSKKEVFLSTYVCHPSMANNELSGPAVTTAIVKWILSDKRKYTYRIIFIPETIGSIVYLSENLESMKKQVIAGFNIACVGDERVYSYLPSRAGNTYADRIALNVLNFKSPNFIKWSYLDRGSDERQYNAPGVDMPVVSIMRSKYGSYPEYHTSLDNLEFVTPKGLFESYEVLKECLNLLENNRKLKIKCLGEPQLGKRGLYPTINSKSSYDEVKSINDFIAYADGTKDLLEISNIINVPVWELYPIIRKLIEVDLLEEV